jgi:hypothetical protein
MLLRGQLAKLTVSPIIPGCLLPVAQKVEGVAECRKKNNAKEVD